MELSEQFGKLNTFEPMLLSSEELGSFEAVPIRAFEPFTENRIYVISLKLSLSRMTLDKALLKVYEPRYLGSRNSSPESLAYGPAKAEAEAAKQRKLGAYKPLGDDLLSDDDLNDDSRDVALASKNTITARCKNPTKTKCKRTARPSAFKGMKYLGTTLVAS